jgi:succinyldiaminopimelate transaminase
VSGGSGFESVAEGGFEGGIEGGFEPPIYPYERLSSAREKASALPGGVVDLSIGTPTDPPPPAVLEALASSDERGMVRGYPPSVGSLALRQAAVGWMNDRLGVDVPVDAVAACVGTKEFVGTLPQWLRLRTPSRDTVLYPAVSYPTYEMGAVLAGCRAVAVPMDAAFRLRLDAVDPSDAARALALWVNTPGNPAGGLDDLDAAAAWGRSHHVPVFSDECYVEFTWHGPPRTILSSGLVGVVALHSLSKRSNLAGIRVGWYAGDPQLVRYLGEVRKHVGLMVPGPVQLAAEAALGEQSHVEAQRHRYWDRLVRMQEVLADVGVDAPLPAGGFYLWAPAPDGDAWGFAERLAAEGGALVSPGDFYGPAGAGHVRVAMVQPMDRLELVASRLGV